MRKSILLFSILCLAFNAMAQELSLTVAGRYTDGREEALEIVTYDSASARIFITNAASDSIDIVDISDITNPTLIGHIDILSYGAGVNSVVALGNGYIAAAIEASPKQNPGKVVFYDTNGSYIADVTVGALPDMLTVSPDGNTIAVANEGEPSDDYTNDPEGSISMIDISGGVMNVMQSDVTTANFAAYSTNSFIGALFKPGVTPQFDLEPEYISWLDNNTAIFVCQENNIIGGISKNGTFSLIDGLGFKDHSQMGNGFDASNDDGKINIQTHPVKGVYQPDAIATYTVNGAPYILTANEGDGRDYGGYSSETRIKDLTLDPTAFPNAAMMQEDTALGRLKTFTADMIGDTDGDGDIDELYSYGARSFSIWDGALNLVYDSGDDFEQYIAANYPSFFNCNDGLASEFDDRSDDKGPEPEAITVGQVGNRTYAFIGLERQGGIMMYNVTDPNNVTFAGFSHSYDVANGTMTDIAPEGLIFIPAAKSHTGSNLVIASHEVSGTTTIFEIDDLTSNEKVLKERGSFKIFPNPTAEEVVNLDAQMDITVFDMLGNVITRTKNTQTVNTAGWARGTYIFVNENGATQRFVKL